MELKPSKNEKEKVKRKNICLPDCVKSIMKEMDYEDSLRERPEKGRRTYSDGKCWTMENPMRSWYPIPDTQGYTKVSVKRENDFTKFYIHHMYQLEKVIVPEEAMREGQFHIVSEPPFLGLYLGDKEFYPIDEFCLTVTDDDVKNARMEAREQARLNLLMEDEYSNTDNRIKYLYDKNMEKPQFKNILDDHPRKAEFKEPDYSPVKDAMPNEIHIQKWNSHENAYTTKANASPKSEFTPRQRDPSLTQDRFNSEFEYKSPNMPSESPYRVYSHPNQSPTRQEFKAKEDFDRKNSLTKPTSQTPEYYRNYRFSIPDSFSMANSDGEKWVKMSDCGSQPATPYYGSEALPKPSTKNVLEENEIPRRSQVSAHRPSVVSMTGEKEAQKKVASPRRSLEVDKSTESPSFRPTPKPFDRDLLRIQSEINPLKIRLAALHTLLQPYRTNRNSTNNHSQTQKQDFPRSSRPKISLGSQTADQLNFQLPRKSQLQKN